MAEEKERKVSEAEVLRVLTKGASTPSDPDDAETIRLFNEQQAEAAQQQEGPTDEERGERTKEPPSQPQTKGKGPA